MLELTFAMPSNFAPKSKIASSKSMHSLLLFSPHQLFYSLIESWQTRNNPLANFFDCSTLSSYFLNTKRFWLSLHHQILRMWKKSTIQLNEVKKKKGINKHISHFIYRNGFRTTSFEPIHRFSLLLFSCIGNVTGRCLALIRSILLQRTNRQIYEHHSWLDFFFLRKWREHLTEILITMNTTNNQIKIHF